MTIISVFRVLLKFISLQDFQLMTTMAFLFAAGGQVGVWEYKKGTISKYHKTNATQQEQHDQEQDCGTSPSVPTIPTSTGGGGGGRGEGQRVQGGYSFKIPLYYCNIKRTTWSRTGWWNISFSYSYWWWWRWKGGGAERVQGGYDVSSSECRPCWFLQSADTLASSVIVIFVIR